jgi:hypothetical protein
MCKWANLMCYRKGYRMLIKTGDLQRCFDLLNNKNVYISPTCSNNTSSTIIHKLLNRLMFSFHIQNRFIKKTNPIMF